MVEIRVIGELAVLRDGVVQTLPASKKTRALLGFLAVTGKPQLRDKLCSLLWDNPDDPRAALRWSLSKLRSIVDDHQIRLVSDRDHVELVPGTATIDLAFVRANVPNLASVGAASPEILRAVAPHLRGELLEGLDLADCHRFDDWLRGEREQFRRLASALLAELVVKTTGDEALGFARDRIAIDSLDESAHVAAIQLLVDLDRKAEALAQYASCERLFERELGRKPSRELERLRVAMLSRQSAVERAPDLSPAPPAAVTAALPMIGRMTERAGLAHVLAPEAKRVAVVVGDPGIGKTRLLDDLAATAASSGFTVFASRGVEAEIVRPYGAWLDALEHDGNPFHVASDASADRARLFDAVTAWLVGRGDVLVIIDDVQWIDEASAALLHYVARAPAAVRIRIACGARPGELADNPAALRLVRGLAREGAMYQIGLSELDASDTAALAAAHAPGIDVARVFAESGGHPLFAVEIARALARGETSWRSLDMLLAERLDLVDGPARELVPWAAALGGAFDAELLATVTGLALVELSRGIDELERRAILRVVGDEWDFTHDLIRAAAYHRISEPRRRLLHRQIARAMAELPEPSGERAVAIAHHAQLGGDAMLCAHACLAAGQRCMRLFAPREAAAHADRGLAHIAKLTGHARVSLHVDLLALAIVADTRRQRQQHFGREIERAIVDARAHGMSSVVARGFNALSHYHFETNDLDGANQDSLKAAETVGNADPIVRARTLAHASQCIALVGGDMAKAESLATEAAELSPPGIEIAELPFALALIRYHQGDTAAAVTLVEHAVTLADVEGMHWLAGYGRARAAQYRYELDDLDLALSHCSRLREGADRFGRADVDLGEVIDACVKLVRGGELVAVDATLTALRADDAPLKLLIALRIASGAALAVGAHDAAFTHAVEATEVASRTKRGAEIAEAHADAARIATASGRYHDARRELDRARAIDVQTSPRARVALAAAESVVHGRA